MESAPFYCFKFLFAQLNSDLSGAIRTKRISVSVTGGLGIYDLTQVGFDGGNSIPVIYNVPNGVSWSGINASIQNNLLIVGMTNQKDETIEVKVFCFPSEWISTQ